MRALTGRQLEILDFVRTYSRENGCPPTIRECASHFGISLGAIQCHFAALQKKGYLSQSDKRSRSVRVIMDAPPEIQILAIQLINYIEEVA